MCQGRLHLTPSAMQPLSVEEILRLHKEAQQRQPNEQDAALRCVQSTIGC